MVFASVRTPEPEGGHTSRAMAAESQIVLILSISQANFTGVIISVNAVAVNGSSYMDPEVAASLTQEEHDAAVYGSKMTLVLEMFTLTCIWTVKACLLILYYRLS